MSKKLLEENTIRQFMKLAKLEPHASEFLEENSNDEETLTESVEEALNEETLDEEDIVNETVKRVMARLSEMKAQAEASDKKDKMIESVTEAILARLNTKK